MEWFETLGETKQWLEQHRTHEGQDIGIRIAGDILPPTEDTENFRLLFPEDWGETVPDERFIFVRTNLENKISILQEFMERMVSPKEVEIAQRKIHRLQERLELLNQQLRKGQ